MHHLHFLYEMDEDKRAEYLMELAQILDAEDDADEWRFSQTMPPQTSYPVIKAKTGHITKLENEDIVERTYSSNSKTRYHLAIPHDELRDDINELGEALDR